MCRLTQIRVVLSGFDGYF